MGSVLSAAGSVMKEKASSGYEQAVDKKKTYQENRQLEKIRKETENKEQ
jgi:hypothetical protein